MSSADLVSFHTSLEVRLQPTKIGPKAIKNIMDTESLFIIYTPQFAKIHQFGGSLADTVIYIEFFFGEQICKNFYHRDHRKHRVNDL